ncbi:hypothetical protein [Deinococcus multiflagellatus]|uniref:Uncharacterized protein n=1 Tax=Deinococcus multiflagellatus TaxID=1656887 RepID=A0ABW1ZRE1_9DEIO|nr:hypothetical protein [Deinococcus multiflagellatus]MBZ9713617.1 hypothetical protein [Deinococcus multiflagellatus]
MSRLTNRKKLRGGHTQLRRVARWRAQYLEPDWFALEHFGVTYAKLWVDPWCRFPRREPPAWVRRELLAGLLDIHAAWARAAAGREDVAYLALWLGWPHFVDSQVVMASPERAQMYRTMFTPAEPRPLPPQLALQDPRLNTLHWQTGLDEVFLSCEEVAARRSWLRRPHRVLTPEVGEPLYALQRGHVWVGRQGGEA